MAREALLMKTQAQPDARATVLGVVAILLWSSTIAFARTISENLGAVRTGALVFLGAGILASVVEIGRPGGFRRFSGLSVRYLFLCGLPFVAYMALLYAAIGTATTREAVIEVGIINYLWPTLVLVFSLGIQGHRARGAFWIGVLLALTGSVVTTVDAQHLSISRFLDHLAPNALPFLMAAAAAGLWALYSNLSRTIGRDSQGNALPLFLLAAGIALSGLAMLLPESAPVWTRRVGWELGYLIVLPTFLAYSLWDFAIQRGHFLFIGAMSYFTPILSTLIAALRLGIHPGLGLWVGCVLVTGGAILSRYTITEASGSCD